MTGNDCIERALRDLVEQAVQDGLLAEGSPGYVITQQVIRQGLDSLSPNYRHIYLTEVVPVLIDIQRRQLC
jgi:hypothetical protein